MDWSAFSEWSSHFRVADACDIALVALLCYLGLVWLQSHASRSFLLAAIVILTLYGLARVFDLYLTLLLFQTGAVAILVAVLVIFQDDLRRAASQFAFRGKTRSEPRQDVVRTVDLIVEATGEFAQDRIGALLVFPGREPLERLLRGGERLNGAVSNSLLASIFHPGSAGHDGAAVVEGDRLTRFAVHLPLSRFPDKVGRQGTRHAAALGLAESSDAFVVVVSEERGTVSVARYGELVVVEPAALKERLERFLAETAPQPAGRAISRWVVRNPGLKIASLLLASLMWLGLAYRVETVQRQYPAPIEFRNLPVGWAVEQNRPVQSRVTISGSERDIERFDPSKLAISLDLAAPREGSGQYPLMAEQVTGMDELDLEVVDIAPNAVALETYRVEEAVLPVRVRLRNQSTSSPDVAPRVEANPAQVTVQRPVALGRDVDAIDTETVDLSRLRGTTTLLLNLELPPRVRLAEGQPAFVEATFFLNAHSPDS